MMAEKESQAHEFVRRRNWTRAIVLYDQLLSPAKVQTGNFKQPRDRTIACLLGRCECLLELERYEECVSDTKRLLKLLISTGDSSKPTADQQQITSDCAGSISRTRRRLIHSLYKLKRFQEAEVFLKEWISEISNQPTSSEISKTLERYKTLVQMANGQKTFQRLSLQRLDEEMTALDRKLEHWSTNNLPLDRYSKLFLNKSVKKRDSIGTGGTVVVGSSTAYNIGNMNCTKTAEQLINNLNLNDTIGDLTTGSGGTTIESLTCSYCAISFRDKNELRQHCQTQSHQNVIMSDEGRDWKWRPPPRGYTKDSYSLCESFSESQLCHYGNQCVEAHGIEELNEWKERFEYRKMKLQRACEKELYGKSYTEELLEKWIQAANPEKIMSEKIEGVDEICSNELVTSISSKISKRDWLFTLKTQYPLKAVALLQDAHRNHFSIKSISPGDSNFNNNSSGSIDDVTTATSTNAENNGNSHHTSTGNVNSNTGNCNSNRKGNSNSSISNADDNNTISASKNKNLEIELKSDQEWVSINFNEKQKQLKQQKSPSSSSSSLNEPSIILEHRIKIAFTTDIYGTFRQSVCFDLGIEPVLVKHICVDVLPVDDAEKIEEIKKDIINSTSTRWDDKNTNLIKFETTIGTHLKTEAYLNDIKREKELLERFPCPRAATFTLTHSTIVEKRLTKNNYRSRIHELLYVEEIARYEQIARYNITTKLEIVSYYMLTPCGMVTSTAKYSHSGELFAILRLGQDISEDTSAGRLILSSCTSVYISLKSSEGKGGGTVVSADPKNTSVGQKSNSSISKSTSGGSEENSDSSSTNSNANKEVYEAMIEDKGKDVIYLKLSSKCVQGLNLKAETEVKFDIQFQLNRLSYCEWHNAVDKITDFRIIFPDTFIEPNIPWTPKKQWSSNLNEPKLNAKQREAVNAITTPISIQLPPILLIGPFGTGKTYTLAQAIKQLLVQPEAKILICTHSNSAADLYIKEYLHPWVEKGMKEATPLRVYYHKRWVATVNSVVQKYCIIDPSGNFRRPSVDDVLKHRIVVVTLSISMELASLGLPKGYFTHIFLDEAAQAMECEAIMPLALATENTRIVLAGDHMQMSPELFSNFAKERRLHISLLERLYDHYPSNFPCKILLCENYRAHEAIIKFTSELFYEQKLIASGKQPRHERFYPLTFFTTRGEDIQDKNSTAFYNNSEVYEVVERVSELKKKWPTTWGKINDQSIGIMTPYADQVFRIRSELRKRRMGGISVERVLNVQGKQFRAVFLSTVRTRRTCVPNEHEEADYGFLSNSKLLNTAITRAQSLVAVVGDPVALCSIGRCRKVWERFIEICNQNKSLFGMSWSYLRSQLDGVELKRSYVLNPLAPEFIPRAMQPEAYLRKQAAIIQAANVAAHQHIQMTANMNQIPHMYGTGAGSHNYNMFGQMSLGNNPQQLMQHKNAQQMSLQNAMQIRSIGPPQPHTGGPQQMFGLNLQSQLTGNQQQSFSSYMMWPQQQQPPPLPSSNQLIRPNFPSQPPIQPPIQPPTHPQSMNAANIWGPNAPHQTIPWLKHMPVTPTNMRNTSQPPLPQPTTQQQQGHSQLSLNMNLRPPPPPPPQPPALPNQQQQLRTPHDMSALNKFMYQNTNNNSAFMGITPSAPPPQSQAINLSGSHQMNLRNPQQMHNGPTSPVSLAALAATAHPGLTAEIFGNGSGNGQRNFNSILHQNANQSHSFLLNGPQNLPKEKEFQFLSNVHNIPFNLSSYEISPSTSSTASVSTANTTTGSNAPIIGPNSSSHNSLFQQQLISLQQQHHAQQQLHDYSILVPPNMTFYEMALEPKESQYKWYLRLLETNGQEVANKFTEILGQVMNMVNLNNLVTMNGGNASSSTNLNKIQQQHNNYQNNQSAIQQQLKLQQSQSQVQLHPASSKTYNFINSSQSSIAPGPHNFVQSNAMNPAMQPAGNAATLADNNVNFNQQIDIVFNSLMNGNNISQPFLRDLLGMVGGNNEEHDLNLLTNETDNTLSIGKTVLAPQSLATSVPVTIPSNNSQPFNNKDYIQFHQTQSQQQQHLAPSIYSSTSNLTQNNSASELTLLQGSGRGGESVPLYRRQVAGNGSTTSGYHSSTSSSASNTQSISSLTPDHLLEMSNPNNMNLYTNNNNSNSNIQYTNNFIVNNNSINDIIEELFGDETNWVNIYGRYSRDIQRKKYEYDLKNGDIDMAYVYRALQMKQEQTQRRQQQQQQQQQIHQMNSNKTHNQFSNFSVSSTLSSSGGCTSSVNSSNAANSCVVNSSTGATYAAVLSQGPSSQHSQFQLTSSSSSLSSINNANNNNNNTNNNNSNNASCSNNNNGGNDKSLQNSKNPAASGEKDPFAAIRELGQRSNGFYNYFQ